MPAACAAFVHFTISDRTRSRNSPGVLGFASAPFTSSILPTSGTLSIRAISPFSRSTSGRGIFSGPRIACH